jgi:ribonuclease-3
VAPEAATAGAAPDDPIGHRFARPELLQRALTHASFGASHNERLEFLGDALLGCVIAEELYSRFPDLREGDLSRLRASLVRRESLAQIARELGLGTRLRLGTGEALSGGRDRDSTLADALEALLAAIHLDAGPESARAAVLRWFGPRLDTLDPRVSQKDAKTELQEYLQARRQALPRYEVTEIAGEAPAPLCRVQCHVDGLAEPVRAEGRNRRIAEQDAAREALARLRGRNDGRNAG